MLPNKTISSFPVAIGTSLSLESIFEGRLEPYDATRKIPNKINISKYKEIWFNIATIFRNLIGAMPNDTIFSLTPEALYIELEQELEVLDSIFLNEGLGTCKPYYYYSTYEHLYKKYAHKKIQFRSSNTDKQKLYDSKYTDTIKLMLKHNPDRLIEVKNYIKPNIRGATALILTHIPYDLLSYTNFKQLDLLESHTGKLKTRYEFSTKYHPLGDEDLTILPFTEKLLMIFGDKVLITPFDIRVRRILLSIAKEREWTPYTTETKMNYFIDLDIKETYLKEWILSL